MDAALRSAAPHLAPSSRQLAPALRGATLAAGLPAQAPAGLGNGWGTRQPLSPKRPPFLRSWTRFSDKSRRHPSTLQIRGTPQAGRDLRRNPRILQALEAGSNGPANLDPAVLGAESVTVILFKHDLRVHDHPGLIAAISSAAEASSCGGTAANGVLLPIFVFDPAVVRGLPLNMLAPLLAAVATLRVSLRERGSDLAVRVGPTADHILLVTSGNELQLKEVLLEEEVESTWQDVIGRLEEALYGAEGQTENAALHMTRWRTPLYENSEVPRCATHPRYLASCGAALRPLAGPSSLPAFPSAVEPGELPSFETLLSLKGRSLLAPPSVEHGAAVAPSPPPLSGSNLVSASEGSSNDGISSNEVVNTNGAITSNNEMAKNGGIRRSTGADLMDEARDVLGDWAVLSHDAVVNEASWGVVCNGELSARAALAEYLGHVEPSAAMKLAVEVEELCPFSSLPSIFGPALSLGLISHRELHSAAIAGSGRSSVSPSDPPLFQRLFPDPWQRVTSAAVRHAQAVEWHELLASVSQALQPPSSTATPVDSANQDILNDSAKKQGAMYSAATGMPMPPGIQVRHWKWRGMLIEFATAHVGPVVENRPPFLLIHGFGAFWQHFRDVMLPLAYEGHSVWALTLPGFGRSAKPDVTYSQYLWSQCVQDFIADVIQEPVIVAGNSIGGYTAACAAADCPQLVRSLVLFNSAGKIDLAESLPPGGSPSSLRHSRKYAAGVVKDKRTKGPPRIIVWSFARLLIAYLQSSTEKVIKRCYPNQPERADRALVDEITRAATDPGSIAVIESVFFLPKPRPLNLLLEIFGGPVLVLQGKNDPLNDAVARANAIKAACPGAAIEFLDAGHCPHDEVPELVVRELLQWATAPWCATLRPGNVEASALDEEGPFEIMEESVMLGVGLDTKGIRSRDQ